MTDILPVRLPYQRNARPRELREAGVPVVSTTTPLVQWGFSTPGATAAVRQWEADEAIRLAYYSNVYVWACARAIAEDIATLTFRAGKDPDKPEDYDPYSPLANILGPPTTKSPDGPLPMISAKTWWEWNIVQLLITGALCNEKVGTGPQTQLWPIPVTKITPIDSNKPGEWFSGFRFGGWGSSTRTLTPDQVLYYWRPRQDDFRRPESVLQAARLDVSVAVMQDRYDFAFLKNDARPASVIVHESFAAAADNDAFEAKFLTDHQGVDNAGKPIFVKTTEDGAPVKDAIAITTLGLSQRDAEFIQRYEMKIRAIVVAFGVPMSRLGDSSDRTFSNAGQEYFNYYRKLKTVCRELQDAVNTGVAPMVSKDYGWFDTQPLDEAIEEAKVQAVGLTDAVKTRLMKINEARDHLGLEAVPDGDRFLTDDELGLLQGAAAQIVVQQAAPPPEEAAPEEAPSAAAPSPSANREALEVETREFTPLPTTTDGRTAEDDRERRLAAYNKRARRVLQHERAMQRAVQELFDRQLTATLSRLQGKRGRQALRASSGEGETREPAAAVDEIFDQAHWLRETTERVRPIFEAIFGDAATTILEELNSEDLFSVDDPSAYHLITTRSNQLAGNITSTTYEAIKNALAEGASEGESIPKLAARISGLFEQTYKNRAVTVARTEVLSAYNGSAMATGQALPSDVVAGFEWLSTPGARTRPAHNAADGQVIPTGARFAVGGTEMSYPGDPSAPPGLVINCRCTLLVLTPGEYQAKTADVNGGFTTISRGAYRFHSHDVALDALLARTVRNPPPEDGWEPPFLGSLGKEVRGDHESHAFHGNQHTGGKGGGGYSSMKVLGNVVVPPGGPQTSKEYAAALRNAGYKGPLSYPKGKLKELYDVHVKGSTESIDVGHAVKGAGKAVGGKSGPAGYEKLDVGSGSPVGTVIKTNGGHLFQVGKSGTEPVSSATKAKFKDAEPGKYAPAGKATSSDKTSTGPDMQHAGVSYEKNDAAPGKQGSIWVKTSGEVMYHNGMSYVPAGPGTTAAFQGKGVGAYHPIGATLKTSAKVPTSNGSHVTGGTAITTSVKTLAHEVDAVKSHEIGDRNWKAGFANQSSAAIKHYSGSGSTTINESMRHGNPTAQATAMHKYILTKGHQLDEKITVDRGVGGTHAAQLKALKAGSEFEYTSFASSTYSHVAQPGHYSVAESFGGGNTVMRITVPKGTRVGIGVYGAGHSGIPGSEKEFILPPGKFRVSHMTTGVKLGSYSSGTIIHMEYLGAT